MPLSEAEMYSRNPRAWRQATALLDALDRIPKEERVCRECGNADPEGLGVVPNIEDPYFVCTPECAGC